MKKLSKLTSSFLSVALACGIMHPCVSAFADVETDANENATYESEFVPSDALHTEWTVTFTGSAMASENNDYAKTISAMQPGDTAVFDITLVNDYDGEVDWYMRNLVLSTMEQGDKEGNSAGAYTYRIIYDDPVDGEILLYSSDMVGAETPGAVVQQDSQVAQSPQVAQDSQAVPQVSQPASTVQANPIVLASAPSAADGIQPDETTGGLKNATAKSGMDEFFYLDTLEPHVTRTMKMVMGIDGETHTNGYFDTDAGALLQYAAEIVTTPEPNIEHKPGEITSTYITEVGDPKVIQRALQGKPLPQTGDLFNIVAVLALILGLIALILGILSWMNDRKQYALAGAISASQDAVRNVVSKMVPTTLSLKGPATNSLFAMLHGSSDGASKEVSEDE